MSTVITILSILLVIDSIAMIVLYDFQSHFIAFLRTICPQYTKYHASPSIRIPTVCRA